MLSVEERRPVEELAARGWPAAETLRRDGWLLRHTPSLTRRRSNSALPLAVSGFFDKLFPPLSR